MGSNGSKTTVIRNGTLIDGSGSPATENDAIVIEGNRIRNVGQLPGEVHVEDRENVQVIDAAGQWIIPGLIDGHVHLSFGNPPNVRSGSGQGDHQRRVQHPSRREERSEGAQGGMYQYVGARRDLVRRRGGPGRRQSRPH